MTVSPALLRLAEAVRIADERPCLASATTALELPALSNAREIHFARTARAKTHRQVGEMLARRCFMETTGVTLPLVVMLVRQAPRQLDDDNLASSLKSVRDGVASWLRIDDRDPRVTWLVDQRKGKPAVEVQVFRREA